MWLWLKGSWICHFAGSLEKKLIHCLLAYPIKLGAALFGSCSHRALEPNSHLALLIGFGEQLQTSS